MELIKPTPSICSTKDYFFLYRSYRYLLKQFNQQSVCDKTLSDKLCSYKKKLKNNQQAIENKKHNLPKVTPNKQLPIYKKWDTLIDHLNHHQVIILCGETGSGKTTQIPQACLMAGLGVRGKIAHTQPRRLAAKTIASRIASELNTSLGDFVGYKVRFDECYNVETTILLQTDGMLLTEIQKDRYLSSYEVIIIDEAHERSLNIDFLLGYLKNLLPKRTDLKIIITSATIDIEMFAKHFSTNNVAAPVLMVEGKTFPVTTLYRPLVKEIYKGNKNISLKTEKLITTQSIDMIDGICHAIEELDNIHYGDTLIFLPTERDIKETQEAIEDMCLKNTEVLALFSRQTATIQKAIFYPKNLRRIILSTNVAETSVTVPRILNVIDTGIVRISRYSYRTKIQSLPIESISQASADQRKGRCGRIDKGVCIRLYSEEDFLSRSIFTDPEIKRTSLATVILQMAVIGLGHIDEFPFVESPDYKMITDGYKLLYELKAVNEKQKVTSLGREMSKLSIDPRLATIALSAQKKGLLAYILPIICGLAVGDIKDRPQDKGQAADMSHNQFAHKQSDFLFFCNVFLVFYPLFKKSKNQANKWAKKHYLSSIRMREWVFLVEQLAEQLNYNIPFSSKLNTVFNFEENEKRFIMSYQQIHESMLVGFLDYIGSYQVENKQYLGIRNNKFYIFPGSFLFKKQYNQIMCAEIVASSKVYARQVAKIQFEWLVPLCKHLIKTTESDPAWYKKQGNVLAKQTVLLYGLPLLSGHLVPYAKTQPDAAHDLFIRHGLVEGDIHTTITEITTNRSLYEKLLKLEEKSRNRDILIDEKQFASLYFNIIPKTVYSEVTLKSWYNQTNDQTKKALTFQKADFLLTENYQVDTKDYPNELTKNNQSFSLDYVFDPASEDDGITVTIPLASLNTFDEIDFDYLVPSLLEEKIITLIKSLPKRYRRQFLPISPYVELIIKDITLMIKKGTYVGKKRLIVHIIDVLNKEKSFNLSPEWFDQTKLDKHYFMNIAIKDKKGRIIAKSRNLDDLKTQFCDLASDDFNQVTKYVFDTIYTNDFPEKIPLTHVIKSKKITAFPALVGIDQDEKLNTKSEVSLFKIDLFDTQEKADKAHEKGVISFLKLMLKKEVIYIKKHVLNHVEITLSYRKLITDATDENLLSDMVDALLLQAYLVVLPREKNNYQMIFNEAKKTLVTEAQKLKETLLLIFSYYNESKRLIHSIFGSHLAITTQINRLVYAGFISKTPIGRLTDVVRYLNGCVIRLNKAKLDKPRDDKWQTIITPFEKKLDQKIGDSPISRKHNKVLLDYIYLLEEYRLSLFAQGKVKIVGKVSEKRLEKAFLECN